MIYYDPLSSDLTFVEKDSFTRFVIFLLLKCKYGDSQHIQDNRDYYVGSDSNSIRRMIYKTWKDINDMDLKRLSYQSRSIPTNIDRYVLLNNRRMPSSMSTQQTGDHHSMSSIFFSCVIIIITFIINIIIYHYHYDDDYYYHDHCIKLYSGNTCYFQTYLFALLCKVANCSSFFFIRFFLLK